MTIKFSNLLMQDMLIDMGNAAPWHISAVKQKSLYVLRSTGDNELTKTFMAPGTYALIMQHQFDNKETMCAFIRPDSSLTEFRADGSIIGQPYETWGGFVTGQQVYEAWSNLPKLVEQEQLGLIVAAEHYKAFIENMDQEIPDARFKPALMAAQESLNINFC